MRLLLPSTLIALIAFLNPLPADQSAFQPPTECGPIAAASVPGTGDTLSSVPQVQGRSADMTIWALLFQRPIEAHKDVKIVWRVTGTGSFQVRGYHPLRATTLPTVGPTEHGASNWKKPGDEWGTWFNFPVAGCWDLHITRGQSSGDLWIDVK